MSYLELRRNLIKEKLDVNIEQECKSAKGTSSESSLTRKQEWQMQTNQSNNCIFSEVFRQRECSSGSSKKAKIWSGKSGLMIRGILTQAGVRENPLGYNNGQPFSTYEQDNNDTNTYNCALKHRGAWWFTFVTTCYNSGLNHCWKWHVGHCAHFCFDSHLNGDYQESGTRSIYLWYSPLCSSIPECGITQTEMKLR
ncbi:Angiopoietin-related protein 6 [Holothuria leucospilota]|uniref:Angiopoietin-related protein 6 n=1 Tax=Holothuria leucospilota TaxID=206669 RepID=A0A9Q1BVB7_HOLLE|nr:Angiopoietin-related protein 6 [Holothuria leucospilota]